MRHVPTSLTHYRAISMGVNSGPRRPYDIDRSIMITVTDKTAFTTLVDANSQRHLLPVTAVAAILTREAWSHFFKRPASVLSFASRYREKLPPGHIQYGLRQSLILNQAANPQVLDSNLVKSGNQFLRCLVMKMSTRALQLQVSERNEIASATRLRAFARF